MTNTDPGPGLYTCRFKFSVGLRCAGPAGHLGGHNTNPDVFRHELPALSSLPTPRFTDWARLVTSENFVTTNPAQHTTIRSLRDSLPPGWLFVRSIPPAELWPFSEVWRCNVCGDHLGVISRLDTEHWPCRCQRDRAVVLPVLPAGDELLK